LTILSTANEVIKTLKLTYKKKEIRFGSTSLLKLEIDNEPCLLIVAIDITERKKATEDLKRNKALTTSMQR
jgi:hypothetical protein